MNGPRGSLVIGLLFLIAGQLGAIAGALTGQPFWNLLGLICVVFAVVAVVGMLIDLVREGYNEPLRPKAERGPSRRERAAARRERAAEQRETARREALDAVPAPVTPTALVDPEGGISADPQERRPDQG